MKVVIMGLSIFLYGVEDDYTIEDFMRHKMKKILYQVGYWRKAYIITNWFIKELYCNDSDNLEYFNVEMGIETIEKLRDDCERTIKHYNNYQQNKPIPDNVLLGKEYDYYFYNRYEKSGYINELEYTIDLCNKILTEDKYEYYLLDISP